MDNNFGSLGDLFPDTAVKCRIRGCKNLVHISGEKTLRNIAEGVTTRADRMCPECSKKFQELEDRQMPCSNPKCDGTWTWNRFMQLEAIAAGHPDKAPLGYCAKCKEEMSTREGIQVPCRNRNCKNTWTWTPRMQLESTDGKPPYRLCDECFAVYKDLQEKTVPCRIKNCQGTVSWSKNQLLELWRSGKSLEKLPPRMCDKCAAELATLQPKEIPCKIKGCQNTWTYSPFEQLEAIRAAKEGEEPAVPSRMCRECYEFYNTAIDSVQPCRNHNCHNTWVWTKSMQLSAKIKGQKKPAPRMCDSCFQRLKALQDMEMPCMEKGCTGTWTYKPEEQLRDQLAGRQPAARHCRECKEFLEHQPVATLRCEKCGKAFEWSIQEQLQYKLKNFDKPSLCADCVSADIAAIKVAEPVTRPERPRLAVKIPAGGKWSEAQETACRPEGMTAEVLDQMQNAGLRIVCLGDEMTQGDFKAGTSWPQMLESSLKQRFAEVDGGVCLLNAGMTDSTTKLSTLRFGRDVLPFEPHLLVFSACYADTKLRYYGRFSEDNLASALDVLQADFEEFLAAVGKMSSCRLLCWLPNPIYPQNNPDDTVDAREKASVDALRVRFYDDWQRRLRTICRQQDVAMLDARSLFDSCGEYGVQRLLTNGLLPNANGAQSIARWMENEIVKNELLKI